MQLCLMMNDEQVLPSNACLFYVDSWIHGTVKFYVIRVYFLPERPTQTQSGLVKLNQTPIFWFIHSRQNQTDGLQTDQYTMSSDIESSVLCTLDGHS